MNTIIMDDGKIIEIAMKQNDFEELLVRGADRIADEILQIFDQDEYIDVAKYEQLKREYDVICDLRCAMFEKNKIRGAWHYYIDGSRLRRLQGIREWSPTDE